MDLTDYETLLAVVQCGGVTKAAERLHRVPSAVTARIQQIERLCGTPLFQREPRKMIPMAAARRLCGYAESILKLSREAELQLKAGEPGGLFRLGALESMAGTRLPAPLHRFAKEFPGVQIALATGTSRPLIARLEAGELDAVLACDVPQDKSLARAPIYREQLAFIAPAGHREIRSPEDTAGEMLLAFPEGCSYRARSLRWFENFKDHPAKIVEMGSYHAIYGAVAAGMGFGLVPVKVLESFAHSECISVFPIAGELGAATTELFWLRGSASPNLTAFQAVLSEEAAAQ